MLRAAISSATNRFTICAFCASGRKSRRRRVHGRYLIFYRVGTDKVVVIHVLAGAMDYEPILFPD